MIHMAFTILSGIAPVEDGITAQPCNNFWVLSACWIPPSCSCHNCLKHKKLNSLSFLLKNWFFIDCWMKFRLPSCSLILSSVFWALSPTISTLSSRFKKLQNSWNLHSDCFLSLSATFSSTSWKPLYTSSPPSLNYLFSFLAFYLYMPLLDLLRALLYFGCFGLVEFKVLKRARTMISFSRFKVSDMVTYLLPKL